MDNYVDWKCFKYKGLAWLALQQTDGVHIFARYFDNYGTFLDIESFKKMYDTQGEDLCLTVKKD